MIFNVILHYFVLYSFPKITILPPPLRVPNPPRVWLSVTKDLFALHEQVIVSFIKQNKKSTICI